MKEKLKKKQEGITLVALVITIIILIILAGISISLILRNDGIVTKAIQGKENMQIATNEEKIALEKLTNQLSENESVNIIDDANPVDPVTQITWTQVGTKVTGSNGQKLEVGDVVLYDCKTEATKSSETINTSDTGHSVNQTFTLSKYSGDWYVLGAEDGKLLIVSSCISSDNSDGKFYLRGQVNGITPLNKVSELYGQSQYVENARSINVDDINKVTGYDPEHTGLNKYTKEGTDLGPFNYDKTTRKLSEYGNEITYSWDGTVYPKYESTNGTNGKLTQSHNNYSFGRVFSFYKDGKWTNIPYTKTPGEITSLISSVYAYYPETLTNIQDNTATIGINSSTKGVKAYNSLFVNTHYFLNSVCILPSTTEVYFDYFIIHSSGKVAYDGIRGSYGLDFNPGYKVRSVVSLKSNVKLTSTDKGYSLSFLEI